MKRYWHVMCDSCGNVYNHEFVDDPEYKAMEMLQADGWTRVNGEDFCQNCWTAA